MTAVIAHPDDNATSEQTRQRLLAYRVDQHEEAIGEIRNAIKSIDKSLQVLALADMQQTQTRIALKRTAGQIEGVARRLQAVELELPTLKLVRNWVIRGVVSVVGIVGLAVVAVVTN